MRLADASSTCALETSNVSFRGCALSSFSVADAAWELDDATSACADPDVPIQTGDNTVDLRGLRAHEAVAMAEQFLDRTLGAGRKVAFLIHGHGTGALRDAVRDALRSSHYVARSRPGGPGEGGDGVTVVWLRG